MPKKSVVDAFLLEDDVESPVDVLNYDFGKSVPNQLPIITGLPYKLAIIGEAPGADEVREGRPFVGISGRFLTSLMSKAGIVRDACLIANVCQHRPPGNDITKFSREGEQITSGLIALGQDLIRADPNVCLLLGKTALWAAKGTDNIGDWRGSWFIGTKPPFVGRKCIATYHPAACLRQYDWTPLLMFDIKKALSGATHPELHLPQRTLKANLSFQALLNELDEVCRKKSSVDIEGYVGAMTCISISVDKSYSFIVPFAKMDGTSYYEALDDEVEIWQRLAKILGDPLIPKVLQNSLYDRFVLQYSYNIVMRGVKDDTMLKSWELYCELEKGLGFLCSLFTDEPFYKFERKSNTSFDHWTYCCRDSAVTYEINDKLETWVSGSSRAHYEMNMALLNPILYMELRGIHYDATLAKQRLNIINHQIWELQYDLDQIAKFGLPPTSTKAELLTAIRTALCYKNDGTRAKKDCEADFQLASRICLGQGDLTKAERGFINIAVGRSMNIKGKEFKKFIYVDLESPKQYHPVTEQLTTNYEALLKISKTKPHRAIELALQIGELRTRAQMLEISCDGDHRVRCGYNVVGTETGRITCYTSPTGSGYNLQTIPAENPLREIGNPLREGMRDLFVADKDHYIFQCDLSGADGWTVAAHLASLGDSTMLEDYRAGIKPAKVLCYLLRHGAGSLSNKTRDEIKELTKSIEKESWDYFASKIGQHGTCYLMGKRLLANTIFIQSEGKVNLKESQTEDLQKLFMVRYRVKLWHDWMTRHLSRQSYPPKLTSASGHIRRFFGRSKEILGEALAHEPQNNTTYATNLAALRLWNDPENRVQDLRTRVLGSGGSCNATVEGASSRRHLRVEPLHQVHDALLGQFLITDTTWAVSKIRQWFQNKLVIAGQEIIIPFEGSYGLNWALDNKSKIGNI